MKRSKQSVLLAGLLAMTLGACTMTGMQGEDAGTDNHYGAPESAASGATDAANAAIAAANAETAATGSTAGATAGQASTEAGGDMDGAGAATAATGTPASAATEYATQSEQSGAMAGISNSTVSNIELVPRQGGDAATGAGTVAGAAVGGTTGASTSADRVYRITLRMDDGTVRTITQETTPAFTTGDRVRLADDAIVR